MESPQPAFDAQIAVPTGASELAPLCVAGNQLQLFVNSAPMFAAMAADIANAKNRVWLETYIFAGDGAGRQIAEALARQARAGLDVRLLYDALGSQSTSARVFADLKAAGVKVHAFHSFLYALRNLSFFEIFNRRNHRKLLIVDDQVAYFGGMNIVDTALPTNHSPPVDKSPPADAPPPVGSVPQPGNTATRDLADAGGWRDVHVRLVGPQAAEVAESFDRSWQRAHHFPIERRPRAYRRVRLPRSGGDFIRFYDGGPGLAFTRAERVFTRLIGLARRRIIMSMAYFLPTRRVLRTILRTRRRGRRVTIIVPGESDVPLVQRATRFLYARLLKRKVEIFERQRSMLHSKAMVVDRKWTVVGSCNLDARSLEINLEFLAVIRSAAFATAVLQICDEELAASHPVTLEDCERHSFFQRILDRGAYLLRRWL